MNFSRSHIGMIGIISLFAGMIAPVLGLGERGYPLPLTSAQNVAYTILFLLALGFYFVSISFWKGIRVITSIIALLLLFSVVLYIRGDIVANDSGKAIDALHWGILCIGTGMIALTYSGFTRRYKTTSETNIISDTIVGIVGTITLLGFSALIIASSISKGQDRTNSSILAKNYGSGYLSHESGISKSVAYKNIESLRFDRKDDTVSFLIQTTSGAVLYPGEIFYTGSDIHRHVIGKKNIIQSDEGIWIDGIFVRYDNLYVGEDILAIQTNSGTRFITSGLDISYTGSTLGITDIATSDDGSTIAWTERTQSGYIVKKDNIIIGNTYSSVTGVTLGKKGRDMMLLGANNNGEIHVVKNGVPIETIRSDYIPGTWKSNGVHSIYTINNGGTISVIYDGVSIGKQFKEVRDIFLESNGGNTYTFFAIKEGENTYCFISRFKGSICGLQGYMNPGLGADGSTIIYAGLKEGVWSLYRNNIQLIRDTGYAKTDIKDDYLFYDKTNPKQYIFLEKYSNQGYQVRKNGKLIPKIWEDVGLDVTFGYDSTIIMSAKDTSGWHIIEL